MKQDRSKLPKWAQAEIGTLEANLAYWKELALSAANEVGETNTYLKQYFPAEDRGLPPDSEIRFDLPGGNEIHVRLRGDAVYVMALCGCLSISPECSNTVELRVKP